MSGSLGLNLAVKSLPRPRSRERTRLIAAGWDVSVEEGESDQSLMLRSEEAVSRQCGMCGEMSTAVQAVSCACNVQIDADGERIS